MRRICAGSMLLLWILTSALASTQASGSIVFTKSEFTREGFEEAVLKGGASRRGWWELYRRDICVINPDGTGFKQLTHDGISHRPRWSPDGGKIAFYSGPPPAVSLHVMDPDGSNRLELVTGQNDIYDFKWSPDGTKVLVYTETRKSIDPEEAWIVAVGDKSSTKRMGKSKWARGWNHWAPEGATVVNPNRRLLDGLPNGTDWPEWSPDNRYIAFTHAGRLVIADATIIGMPEKWRASKTEPPCERIGDWSPDGSKIIFFAGGNVCSINFDETGVMNLSMSEAEDACWSPDASQIAFASTDGRKKNTEIFIMNADGTGHVQLTNTNYFHMDVHWR
jgi:Tol biopolymer transport system component